MMASNAHILYSLSSHSAGGHSTVSTLLYMFRSLVVQRSWASSLYSITHLQERTFPETENVLCYIFDYGDSDIVILMI